MMDDVLIERRGGNFASIQVFLIFSTCFLYLVAAGLFSKAVWFFENYKAST
jgi:high-affinity iron transporter